MNSYNSNVKSKNLNIITSPSNRLKENFLGESENLPILKVFHNNKQRNSNLKIYKSNNCQISETPTVYDYNSKHNNKNFFSFKNKEDRI